MTPITETITAAAASAGYYVDCFRKSDGTPLRGSHMWFVARATDGAELARCKSEDNAWQAMARRLRKEGRL